MISGERAGKSECEVISDVFSSSLRLSDLKDADSAEWASFHWPLVVGKELSKITKTSGIVKKVLQVQVQKNEWAPALESLKSKFIREINQRAGKTLLTGINFKMES